MLIYDVLIRSEALILIRSYYRYGQTIGSYNKIINPIRVLVKMSQCDSDSQDLESLMTGSCLG